MITDDWKPNIEFFVMLRKPIVSFTLKVIVIYAFETLNAVNYSTYNSSSYLLF